MGASAGHRPFGADTLARLAHGLRLTLFTGILSLLVAQLIGGLFGLAILAKQPQFAQIIVKTISQIMALLWVVTMSIFLFATLTDGSDTLEWTVGLITHLITFGAALVWLVLRKKASLLPELPKRTRWTGMGWPLYIGTSIGLVIAPFTLRTTLAAGQTNRVPQAIGLGLFSALAWALLASSFLSLIGMGQTSFNTDLGRLMMNDLPDPTVPLVALFTLIITIASLVLTGGGIRLASTKRGP